MLKQIFLNIRRYSSVSFDMVIFIALFLFILGSMLLFRTNFENFSDSVKDKLEIAIFVKNGINLTSEKIDELKNKILENDEKNVKNIIFVDKETALKTFIAENQDFSEEFQILKENPLKNYFIIKLKNKNYKKITNFVDGIVRLDFVDDLVYSQDLVQNIENFLNKLTKIGFILFLILLALAFFIILYTIKIYLHYRKNEFLLWRYFGAKARTIFTLIFGEAFILGFLASVLAIALVYLFYYSISVLLFNIQFLQLEYVGFICIFGILMSMITNLIVYTKSQHGTF